MPCSKNSLKRSGHKPQTASLYAKAKDADIAGRSAMSKEELAERLSEKGR
jgi:hypothetical protein